jgi:N-acetylmuramoyl-L-alanine amidase
MTDNRLPNDPSQPADWPSEPGSDDVPASVTFMEMMRQAAARANASAPNVPAPEHPVWRPPQSEATPRSTAPAASVDSSASMSEAKRQEAMEEQRIRRVKRRRARRRQQTVGVLGGIIRTLIVVLIAAGLMATIFMFSTPPQFIDDDVQQELGAMQAVGSAPTSIPTLVPTPNWLRRIGIVSGHRGPQVPPDPGAVCPDGLTEAEINFAVAQLVVRNLRARGYSVDLLDEFDPRLDNYQAAALVSIHANTCQDFGEAVTGFLIARAAARLSGGLDDLLVDCVARYYGQETGLVRREGVTIDMTDYHTFREIHPLTPASIIELGFMLADRPVLTGKQEEMAQGISDGIICFLEPSLPPPLATGTAAP